MVVGRGLNPQPRVPFGLRRILRKSWCFLVNGTREVKEVCLSFLRYWRRVSKEGHLQGVPAWQEF